MPSFFSQLLLNLLNVLGLPDERGKHDINVLLHTKTKVILPGMETWELDNEDCNIIIQENEMVNYYLHAIQMCVKPIKHSQMVHQPLRQ